MKRQHKAYFTMFKLLKWEIKDARPIKIKATDEFVSWLVECDKVAFIKDDSKRGFYVALNFIPIEIDDTIENEYYEFVY